MHDPEAEYRQSLEPQPDDPDALHHLGLSAYRAGRTAEAIDLLSRAVRLNPQSAGFQYDLGNAHQSLGQTAAAIECFRAAILADPRHAPAHLGLGDALMDAGQYDDSAAAYRQAIANCDPFPEAQHNLATLLVHMDKAAEAVAACQAAIAARPDYALAYNTLGVALVRLGRIDEASAALQRAIQLKPGYAKAHHNLGGVLDQLGRVEPAIDAYREAVRLNPQLIEARYDLAALGAAPPPPAMPTPYLLRLFDGYAATFDQHLVETLDYRVPELLLAAVEATHPRGPLDVIDLGCGTGLVGKLFRDLAGNLTGVDVSPGMIRQAERRAVYDQLVQGDILRYLSARQEPCDLVLAADVFIYMGELSGVFQAASRLLRPGGLFAFSIESIEGDDWVLRPTRRYAQSLAYIRRLAAEHGFRPIAANPVKIRDHHGADVPGYVVVLES